MQQYVLVKKLSSNYRVTVHAYVWFTDAIFVTLLFITGLALFYFSRTMIIFQGLIYILLFSRQISNSRTFKDLHENQGLFKTCGNPVSNNWTHYLVKKKVH